jgi:serine/threonine-protein kinase
MDLSSPGPDTLGKYQIRGVLGRGAMGTVYDGWDPVIGRRVAIKTVRLLDHADPEAQEGLERFKREAQAAGRLSHPNIVGVYDYGETDETAYIVMEFVEGQSLKQMLDARERFQIAETVRIMEQVLAGLQFSHDSGVVHRDIKPGNVMIAKGGRVKLADFGIARIESSVMTQDGTMLGTPAYMSPEQLMAQTVDSRSDLYSAGVMLYQLLTGERPFEGGLTAIIHKALNTTPPRPSEISVTAPASLDAVVARAMAKRPFDRYPDADSFARDLRAAVATPAPSVEMDGDATLVTRPAPPPPMPAPQPAPVQAPALAAPEDGGSGKVVLVGIAAAVVLAIGIGAWLALRPSTTAPPVEVARTETPVASAPKPAPAPPPPAVAPQPAPAATTQASAPPTSTPPASAPTASAPAAVVVPKIEAPKTEATVAKPAEPAVPPPASPAPTAPPSMAIAAAPPPLPASPPPTATPAPHPPQVAVVAPPNPAALRTALAALALSSDCAVPRFGVSDDGGVNVTGLVGSGAPSTALRASVRDAVGSAQLSWLMRPVDGPYCAAFDVIRPIDQPGSPPFGLTMKDDMLRLKDGQAIRPVLTMPDFPAHLRVDYLSHDGSVTHLFPEQGARPKPFAANATVLLGDPKKGVGDVGPPFGTDVILAVASSVPLFTQPRPAAEENAETYLPALQAAIEAARRANAKVTGRVLALDTEAR